MTIVDLCHEILHLSDTWTPQYSCSIVSNLSSLSLVLHLRASMHASLNSCIKVSKSHEKVEEDLVCVYSILFVLLPLSQSQSLSLIPLVTCVYNNTQHIQLAGKFTQNVDFLFFSNKRYKDSEINNWLGNCHQWADVIQYEKFPLLYSVIYMYEYPNLLSPPISAPPSPTPFPLSLYPFLPPSLPSHDLSFSWIREYMYTSYGLQLLWLVLSGVHANINIKS